MWGAPMAQKIVDMFRGGVGISDRLIYLAILRDFSGCLGDPKKTQLFGIFWDISSLCFCLRDMLKEPTSPKTKIEEGRAGIQKYPKKIG